MGRISRYAVVGIVVGTSFTAHASLWTRVRDAVTAPVRVPAEAVIEAVKKPTLSNTVDVVTSPARAVKETADNVLEAGNEAVEGHPDIQKALDGKTVTIGVGTFGGPSGGGSGTSGESSSKVEVTANRAPAADASAGNPESADAQRWKAMGDCFGCVQNFSLTNPAPYSDADLSDIESCVNCAKAIVNPPRDGNVVTPSPAAPVQTPTPAPGPTPTAGPTAAPPAAVATPTPSPAAPSAPGEIARPGVVP